MTARKHPGVRERVPTQASAAPHVRPPSRARAWVWAVLSVSVLAALAGAAWLAVLRPAQRAGGIDLGRLPSGVARENLNLVVITLDTTRADRLGSYGSRDVETPAVDRLAREGVLFEQAMTSAPLTLPAHASIFTGRFPPEHGARDNGGFFLSPEQITLAEVLGDHGFETGGFVAAFVLDGKWGINQGFHTYFDDFDRSKNRGRSSGDIQRPANEVVDTALPWMDGVKNGRFFAWLHFYDPHTPYAPPEPFETRYKDHPYNGEIAFADSQVARVVEFLESRGLLDKTIVAVLGDHGESLGEHGENAHGFFIYEAATHVPFIIRAPFALTRGHRVADPVRVVDLMPTVLDLVGVPSPKGLSGVSLVPLMTGSTDALGLEGYAEAMYPLHHYGWSDLRALRVGRYKVIDAPRPELYDLDSDPRETTNLFDQRGPLGNRMVARLRDLDRAFDKPTVEPPATDVDPEVRARLAALGYVGSFVASANDPRTDRADPKDKIDLFNLMGDARDLAPARGSFAKVAGLLRRVIAADPNVIDAWFSLGNAYFKEGRYREAIEHFTRALELKPDYDLAVINIAAAYRRLGDDEAALAGFEHYLTIDPRDAYVRYQVGEIWLDRGNLEQAARFFREALEMDDHVAPAKNALGVIEYRRGDLEGAERLIRDALALRSDVRLAHYNLALVAEARGDLQTAEREYLEELEIHPDSYKAAFNLSRLYEKTGERQLRIDALRQAIDGNPVFADGHIALAQAYLESGSNLDNAARLAQKGLELSPHAEMAPLGHYVLADIFNRRGQRDAAARELARGRALEAQRAR